MMVSGGSVSLEESSHAAPTTHRSETVTLGPTTPGYVHTISYILDTSGIWGQKPLIKDNLEEDKPDNLLFI